MAYSKIIHTKSEVAGAIPDGSSLSYGEIAINYSDGHMYIRKSDDVVQKIASVDDSAKITIIEGGINVLEAKLIETSLLLSEEMLTSEIITSDVELGGINQLDTVPVASSLQDFIKQLLLRTEYPTFVSPYVDITSDAGINVESGTNNIVLTAGFDQGDILGKKVAGIWQANVSYGFNSGAANTYEFFNDSTSLASGTSDNYNVTLTIDDGVNTFSVDTQYAEGTQAIDSNGADFGDPLPAGNVGDTVIIYGRRNAFYGTSVAASSPNDNAGIRALGGTKINPGNNTTFAISIPAGAAHVVFAYPSTIRDVTSVIEGVLNSPVTGAFTQSTVSVEGANAYTAVDYKVYTFTPTLPFADAATYTVTI